MANYSEEIIHEIEGIYNECAIKVSNIKPNKRRTNEYYVPLRMFNTLVFPILARIFRARTVIKFAGVNTRFTGGHKIQAIYDLSFIKFPSHYTSKDLAQQNRYFRKALSISDAFLTCSYTTKAELQKYTNKPIYVIYPKIEMTERSIYEVKRLTNNYFLIIGSDHPRKRIDLVIDLFSSLNEKLIIIGGYKGGENIPDNVKIMGYVDNETKLELIENCKTIIVPSIDEGFGLPIAEALLYGKKPLCSDIPIFREIAEGYAVYTNFEKDHFKCDIQQSFDTKPSEYFKKYNQIRKEQLSSFALKLL